MAEGSADVEGVGGAAEERVGVEGMRDGVGAHVDGAFDVEGAEADVDAEGEVSCLTRLKDAIMDTGTQPRESICEEEELWLENQLNNTNQTRRGKGGARSALIKRSKYKHRTHENKSKKTSTQLTCCLNQKSVTKFCTLK